jgi:hypothetical protein
MPQPGGPRTVTDEQVADVVTKTLESTPRSATRWSTKVTAKEMGACRESGRRSASGRSDSSSPADESADTTVRPTGCRSRDASPAPSPLMSPTIPHTRRGARCTVTLPLG